MENLNREKLISRDELAHFAAALAKRIRDDNSIDINEFKTAQEFFLEYVTDTKFIKAFAEKSNYRIVESVTN